MLRWHLQLGNVVIPKSTTPARIRENIAVFDFALADEDMAVLAGLETGTRLGPDPDERDTRRRPGFSSTGGRWAERPEPPAETSVLLQREPVLPVEHFAIS